MHLSGLQSELDRVQLELLDNLTVSLFESLELQHRLDAVLRFFVPRIAAWAFVTIPDDEGEPRVAARLGPITEAGVTQTRTFDLLSRAGEAVGSLHLSLLPDEPLFSEPFLNRAAERCAQALHNARMYEREQRVALTFQNAALSSTLPQAAPYCFDAVYEAGRADVLVGGDWYDAFALPDGRCVVSIGDVMGSGLKAAVAMISVRQTMRGVVHIHPDPVLMLQAADSTLQEQYPDRYVTTFVAVLDPITQTCTYANAGHPAPYLRTREGVRQLHGSGAPLGLGVLHNELDIFVTALEPGSVLLLYTDGLTEATRDVLEGERRVAESLERLAPDSEVARAVYRDVLPNHARDDVAILGVRVGDGPQALRWRFDPRWPDVGKRVRLELSDELVRSGFEPQRLFSFELIFAELLANLIRYAPGTAEAILEIRPDAFVLHTIDKGPGFQFLARLPQDLFSERGRGLFLISQMACEFNVERRPGGGSHARVVLAYRNRSTEQR